MKKEKKPQTRTLQQNKALHVYCENLAEALNAAGYDMKRTLKHDVDIPWSKETVKEFLWRPIQQALIDKDSTTELNSAEPSDIHAVLSRHLGEKLGIYVEWPSEETRGRPLDK